LECGDGSGREGACQAKKSRDIKQMYATKERERRGREK